jgi:hypothetical protein
MTFLLKLSQSFTLGDEVEADDSMALVKLEDQKETGKPTEKRRGPIKTDEKS